MRWVRDMSFVLERDIGKYLLYELRLLPVRTEVEYLAHDGETVAAGIERLYKRIARIRRKRNDK